MEIKARDTDYAVIGKNMSLKAMRIYPGVSPRKTGESSKRRRSGIDPRALRHLVLGEKFPSGAVLDLLVLWYISFILQKESWIWGSPRMLWKGVLRACGPRADSAAAWQSPGTPCAGMGAWHHTGSQDVSVEWMCRAGKFLGKRGGKSRLDSEAPAREP